MTTAYVEDDVEDDGVKMMMMEMVGMMEMMVGVGWKREKKKEKKDDDENNVERNPIRCRCVLMCVLVGGGVMWRVLVWCEDKINHLTALSFPCSSIPRSFISRSSLALPCLVLVPPLPPLPPLPPFLPFPPFRCSGTITTVKDIRNAAT